ncbi:MAG: 3-oxoacyl-[acyl-carrier-protein] reductase [Chloroherpetonaceae bacterium]|nr:3-oxoacyl-[acyl-carrier-protein] reductase [Chloroherpetonaceae bacterium]
MEISLSGQVALVTGGTRGIGRAICLRLAEAGAAIAFTYKSSVNKAESLKAELMEMGRPALAIQASAESYQAAEEAVLQTQQTLGGLHILVNNAGITRDTLLMRMSETQWDEVIASNLKSVFNYTKAALRPMLAQRSGRIVSITSVVGLTGNAGQANYAASKAGIIGFTKAVAKEIASRNVLVNAVAPGFIDTEMTGALSEEQRKSMEAAIPMKRTGSAKEVADVVLFLCSPLASYITGETLRVDGGLAM